jgi:hypothetical protein
MERPVAPGKCVDCGNDAFIRLASSDGGADMICGHCYAERLNRRGVGTKTLPPIPTRAKPPPRP